MSSNGDDAILERVPLQTEAGNVKQRLAGHLTARDAFAMVISNIIGSGIFVTPGLVYVQTGSPCGAIVAWVLAGIISLLGALCYAELGTGQVDAGAESAYFQKAFNSDVAFTFVFVLFMVLAPGSVAIESTVFARYLLAVFGVQTRWAVQAAAVSLIIVLGAVNVQASAKSAMIQMVMVVFKLCAVVVVAAGALFASPGVRNLSALGSSQHCFAGTNPSTFALGLIACLFSYSGFNSVCSLSEEFATPQRDLPVGIVAGMVVVLVVYLLANLSFLITLPASVLSNSKSVGYDFALIVGGHTFADVLSVMVAMTTMGAAHSTIFSASRVVFAAGRDGLFFEWFAYVNDAGTPSNAVLAITAWSCILVVAGSNVAELIDYAGVAGWFYAGLAALALIRLRRGPGSPGQFRVPWYPLVPVVSATASAALVASSIVEDFWPSVAVALIIAAAFAVHYLANRPDMH
ncbi:hypothetical protein PBRA_005834 [Plasmodiophora brassicae]|uniref:Amino acid permease/ SLC12A domain-containing protein n=1 Tax=Plasmodiophora brassicae TaxID=37360 RepID=A0A0G4IR36_PLABS|nr:hypothetical protein PBRA_005834 [Plasmodiophora brassicae]